MQCLSNTVSAGYVILTSRAWMMWQSLSYLHSFPCYATQSSNPSRQVFLIDIKTNEKVPEFMEDVLTELGIRQLSFRTREIRGGMFKDVRDPVCKYMLSHKHSVATKSQFQSKKLYFWFVYYVAKCKELAKVFMPSSTFKWARNAFGLKSRCQ